MYINRGHLAALVSAAALLATMVLPGSATAAPQAVADQPVVGSRTGVVPGALGADAARAGGTGATTGGAEAATGSAGGTGGAGATTPSAGVATVAPPRVKAGSVLLADEETGQVLFEHAERQPRAMASTTKVMTGLLALEHLDQRRTVVIGTEPTTVGEESLKLRKGERLTVHQLLLGLLVKSANDAAVALADAVDGSEAAFVRQMNTRAAQLGLRDTHYVTPYGLDRPGHRTSARDLARLWEVAMRRTDFRVLVSTRSARLPGPARFRKFTNTNQLLGSYAWAVGGKTGFTDDAGRCLVASASRGGRRLVAVALGSPDAFSDVRVLFEYGFTAFDWVRLAQRGQAVTLAGTAGQTTAYQVTADADALVRRDLLARLTLAPPARLIPAPTAQAAASTGGGGTRSPAVASGNGSPGSTQDPATPAGGTLTVWIQAGGRRLAPLRLGAPGPASAGGSAQASAGGSAQASAGGSAQASAGGSAQAIPPLSSLAPGLVPPGSVPAAIDPFLRRAPR